MLILSLFPGIDLLGMAFEGQGDCVVRGPDPLFGGDIRGFTPPAGRFDGVIGGPPCQDFSRARRCPPSGLGLELLGEFVRCVAAAQPAWFLCENVPGVPDISVEGYVMQRFNLAAAECGCRHRRLRRFQFGSLDGVPLTIKRLAMRSSRFERTPLASEARRSGRRSWEAVCELQGLPAGFALPQLTIAARYRAVGNGVPLAMGRVLAIAVHRRHAAAGQATCDCGCGRPVCGERRFFDGSCRKRVSRRRRDAGAASRPGSDAAASPRPPARPRPARGRSDAPACLLF